MPGHRRSFGGASSLVGRGHGDLAVTADGDDALSLLDRTKAHGLAGEEGRKRAERERCQRTPGKRGSQIAWRK
jgi:hypothetical protein